MLDAARLVESVEYYYRFVDFCAEWNINTIIFRLTDNEGCAVRFESHPELFYHPNAIDAKTIHNLALYGMQKNIAIIPEIESFGHSGYITKSPAWAHLDDKASNTDNWRKGLIPLHPDTIQILTDLYQEVSSLFPAPYLHGGCDEVDWGGSDFSINLLKTKTKPVVWAEYLNALNQIAHKCEKEFIVWGDYILRHNEVDMDLLDKNIIIHDWNYWDNDPVAIEKTAERAISRGFRIIGGPAAWWCKWGPYIGREQLRNIDAFAAAYEKINSEQILGIITTQWVPGRYIQGAAWSAFAYAATAMNCGAREARQKALPSFVEKHFGTKWNDNWDEVFRTLYDSMPGRRGCSPHWFKPFLPVPWTNDKELLEAGKSETPSSAPFKRVMRRLKSLKKLVNKNKDDFHALYLTARYTCHIIERQQMLNDFFFSKSKDYSVFTALLEQIFNEDKKIIKALKADWKNTRGTIKLNLLPAFISTPEDRMTFQLIESAHYIETLLKSTERIKEIISL